LLVRTYFRFWIRCRVPEIFAVKVGSGPKLTEILHVFGPQFFWGEHPRNFWSGIIKFSQVLIMWQSFRELVRRLTKQKNIWGQTEARPELIVPGGLTRGAIVTKSQQLSRCHDATCYKNMDSKVHT